MGRRRGEKSLQKDELTERELNLQWRDRSRETLTLAGGGSLIAIHSSPSQSHVNATIITIKEGKDIKILFAGKYFV